jgi:hypothetical protein
MLTVKGGGPERVLTLVLFAAARATSRGSKEMRVNNRTVTYGPYPAWVETETLRFMLIDDRFAFDSGHCADISERPIRADTDRNDHLRDGVGAQHRCRARSR